MAENENAGAEAEKAPVPGSPEYDAQMADKFRSSQDPADRDAIAALGGQQDNPAGATTARPEGVPEKFWDAEKGEVRVDALLKSYTELESGKGGAEKPKPVQIDGEDKTAQEAVDKAGLNWDDLGNKLTTKGDLDAEDYAALAKAGVPENIVRDYVARVNADTERTHKEALEYGGGEEKVTALLDWAAKTLTPEEISGYNQMLSSTSWKVALDTLSARQAKAAPGGQEPNLVTVNGRLGGTTVGYNSEDEMKADMREPLYREMSPKGEQFRAQVREKVRLAAYRRKQ